VHLSAVRSSTRDDWNHSTQSATRIDVHGRAGLACRPIRVEVLGGENEAKKASSIQGSVELPDNVLACIDIPRSKENPQFLAGFGLDGG
jgi:hypothetical protein